jgi:hypothetical protein
MIVAVATLNQRWVYIAGLSRGTTSAMFEAESLLAYYNTLWGTFHGNDD